MIFTVSLLLLVAIGHAAEQSSDDRRKQDEEDNYTAKRELLEGNYGLRIQPSLLETGLHSTAASSFEDTFRYEQQKLSTQEFGPPRVPVKISDVLAGLGPSYPAAIDGHLYSPVSIYQHKLGPFELSPPVPSQLAYSEHITLNNYLNSQLNPNFESPTLRQPQQFQSIQQQNNERLESLTNSRPMTPGQPLDTRGDKRENIQNDETQRNLQNLVQNSEDTRQAKTEQSRQTEQNIRQDNIRKENLQNSQTVKQLESQRHQEQTQRQPLQPLQVDLLPTLTELQPTRPDVIPEQFLPQARPIYSEQIIQQVFPQVQGFPVDFFQQINQLSQELTNHEEAIQYVSPDEAKAYGAKQQNKTIEHNASQVTIQTTTENPTSTTQEQSSTNQKQNAVSYVRFSQGLQPPNQIQDQPQQILQILQTPSLLPQLPPPQFQELPLIQEPQQFQTPEHLPVQIIEQATPQPQLQSLSLQHVYQVPLQPTIQPLTSSAPLQTLFSTNQPRRVIIRIRDGTNSVTQSQPAFTTQPQSTPHVSDLNSQPTFASTELNSLNNEISSTESTNIASKVTTPSSISIIPKFVSTLQTKPAQPSTLVTSTLPSPTLLPLEPTLIPSQQFEPQPITQPQIQPTHEPVQVLTSPPYPTPNPAPEQQQAIPGIRAVPVHRYQIQSELQPLVRQEQQVQLVRLQPIQPPSYTSPQLVQLVQIQPQQLQSQYQSQSQSQPQFNIEQTGHQNQNQLSSGQSEPQPKPGQSKHQQSSEQSDQQQHLHQQQSQQEQEVVSHAQTLLHNLYSSYLHQPVYSEAQEALIQQPHYGASLSYPSSQSSSYPVFQAAPTFPSVQFFGKYAPEIFGGNYLYKKK